MLQGMEADMLLDEWGHDIQTLIMLMSGKCAAKAYRKYRKYWNYKPKHAMGMEVFAFINNYITPQGKAEMLEHD